MYFDDDEYNVEPPRGRRFWTSRRVVLPRRDPQGRRIVESPNDGKASSFDAADADEIGADEIGADERGTDATRADEPYVPAPEDFLPSPPKPRGPLSRRPAIEHARPALIMFALFFAASFTHWSDPRRSLVAADRDAVLDGGEWWRLLTALFTHSDMDHLASNTPLFLIFGWFLHAYFGALAFPVGALVIGVLSNLATIAVMSAGGSLVGASGMLYGMVALWLVLYVRFEIAYTVPVRIFRAVGVSLLLLFPTTFHPTTSYTAHAFGFLIGLVVGLALAPVIKVRDAENAASTTAV